MATYDELNRPPMATQGGLLGQSQGGGLLSLASSPAGQGILAAGLSLMANARRRGVGAWNNAGAAGLAGLQGYEGAKQGQRQEVLDGQRAKLWDAQHQNALTQNDVQKLDLDQKRRRINFLGTPQPQGTQGPTQGLPALPDGSAPQQPAPIAAHGGPPQINPLEALQNGYNIEEARALTEMKNWGAPKIARYVEAPSANGGVEMVGLDEFGRPVNTGVKPWKDPIWRDGGGRDVALDAVTLKELKRLPKTMTPGEVAADRRAGQRLLQDKNQPKGQIIQTDQGYMLVDNRTGSATPVVGPGGTSLEPKLRDIPAAQNTAFTENGKALTNIDDAIAEVARSTGYTIDAAGNVTKVKDAKPTAPDALGGWNYLPDAVRQRSDSEGVPLRAKLANISTGKYHDLSGTAVTASEAERLKPFVPSSTDTPEVVLKKLHNLRREYQGVNESLSATYSREQGYRPNPAKKSRPPLNQFGGNQGARPPLTTFER